jgi:hypothetical protein
MSFKSFITKSALRMKGVSKEQDKEVKTLMEKIQKEIEEKTKAGMPEMYASIQVMGKYKAEMMKYREELAPLMQLMMKK